MELSSFKNRAYPWPYRFSIITSHIRQKKKRIRENKVGWSKKWPHTVAQRFWNETCPLDSINPSLLLSHTSFSTSFLRIRPILDEEYREILGIQELKNSNPLMPASQYEESWFPLDFPLGIKAVVRLELVSSAPLAPNAPDFRLRIHAHHSDGELTSGNFVRLRRKATPAGTRTAVSSTWKELDTYDLIHHPNSSSCRCACGRPVTSSHYATVPVLSQ